MTLDNPILVAHIFFGFVALTSGLLPMVLKKGGKGHRWSGTVFFWSMLGAAFLSLLLTEFNPNAFLYSIGLFTLYQVLIGRLALYPPSAFRRGAFWFCTVVLVYTTALMVYFSAKALPDGNMLGVVTTVFALLCVQFVRIDLTFFVRQKHELRMRVHLGRMIGAYIAAATAFIVTNIAFHWVLFLLPTFLGSFMLVYWNRKLNVK